MFTALARRLLSSSEEQKELTRLDDIQVAVAVLLIEAGYMDGEFSDSEKEAVGRALKRKFSLSDEELKRLLQEAEKNHQEANGLYGSARLIKDHFPHEKRVQVVEMLWGIVYADGHVDDYEANLVRRVAGLIYVSDVESGTARKRALKDMQTHKSVS